MALQNSDTGWGWPARVIHWLMAVLMIGMLAVGFYMTRLSDLIARYELTQQHKSVGFTVFVLAVLRVVWRLMNRKTPALPDHMPRWQVGASHASHLALYILIFALPLTGWLMASSSPLNDEGAFPFRIPNKVFGLFEMPDPFTTGDKGLSELFQQAHELCAFALIAVLLVHAGAALKHHLFERDRILMRMITGR